MRCGHAFLRSTMRAPAMGFDSVHLGAKSATARAAVDNTESLITLPTGIHAPLDPSLADAAILRDALAVVHLTFAGKCGHSPRRTP